MRTSQDNETSQNGDGDYISGSRREDDSEHDRNRQFHVWEDETE